MAYPIFPRGIPALALVLGFHAYAQSPLLILQPIDETQTVTLGGSTRPEATLQNSRGRIDDSFRLEHILLQLRRPPERERDLEALIAEMHHPGSPHYHRWLSAAEFGATFGLAQQDLETIQRWLESHGFTVNNVYPSGELMDFSGTAGQIREAFHTEIHRLWVDGEMHIGNMGDPQIPAALAPAISGIVSLHDFRPHAMLHHAQYTAPVNGQNYYLVAPPDLARIYRDDFAVQEDRQRPNDCGGRRFGFLQCVRLDCFSCGVWARPL